MRAYFKLTPEQRRHRRAPIELDILNDTDVADSLQALFSSKCAYCESKLSREVATVSHFRPLSNAVSSKRERDSPEHYSWLAYEWRNLLLLCQQCDSSKQNYFPVRGMRAEPLTPWPAVQRIERPVLLDPTVDRPQLHISASDRGMLLPLTDEGAATIAILSLNRPELVERRQALLVEIGELLVRDGPDVTTTLNRAMDRGSEYSGVVSLYLFGLCKTITRERYPSRKSQYANLVTTLVNLREELSPADWSNFITEHRFHPAHDLRQSRARISEDFHDSLRDQPLLTSILIQDLKGIDMLKLDLAADVQSTYRLPPSAMLLGENATCKSTVLQAVALTLMGKRERSVLRLDASDFLPRLPEAWVPDYGRHPKVVLGFHDGRTRTLEYDHERDAFHSADKDNFSVLAYGARRFFARRGQRGRVAPRNKTLFDPLALLHDPSVWLEDADEHVFDAVVRAMRPVLSLRDEEDIVRLADKRVMVSAHGRLTPIAQMSDGYRVLFAMATDIMRNMVEVWGNLELARGIVLVDEIETHLHPRWKRRVMTALRAAMPRVQFLATTHDPLCLRGMHNGEVHVLYRDEDAKVALVEDLPDISTLRAEQILTSDYFGLESTADAEQEGVLIRLAALAGKRDADLAPEERRERDNLLACFDGLPVIGDSIERQILAEAMTRHLQHQADRPTLAARAGQRAQAIDSIIDVLERALER